jgi:hypothetical protein
MNNYICTFNYQNEVTRLETEAENRDNAFSKTISVMAKKYSKSRESMLLYFNGEKDKYEIREKEKQDYRDWRVEQMTANGYFNRAFYGGL